MRETARQREGEKKTCRAPPAVALVDHVRRHPRHPHLAPEEAVRNQPLEDRRLLNHVGAIRARAKDEHMRRALGDRRSQARDAQQKKNQERQRGRAAPKRRGALRGGRKEEEGGRRERGNDIHRNTKAKKGMHGPL